VNLLPAAEGKATLPADRAVYGAIYPGDASSLGHPERDVAHRWVRQGNLKLITAHNANAQGKTWNNYTKGDVLYDVVKDPGETSNLIDDPSFKAQQQQLRQLLDQWWSPES
jgi:uncharacterized sulfatase